MIFEILRRLNREFKKTVIIVEQKIMMLAKYADRILVLDEGELVFDGPVDRLWRRFPV